MNKRMLYFLFLVVFIFSFMNEKNDLAKLIPFKKNEDCRISKIYLNSELSNEFHYDKNNNLIKSEWFYCENYYFSTFGFDDLERLITSNIYYTRAGQMSLRPDSSNFIQVRSKAEFKYKEDKNLIDEVRYYRGSSTLSDEDVKDGKLKYTQKMNFFYDSGGALKEIVLGKKKRKSAKVKFTYDDLQNPILIEYYENKKNGRLYKSIERKYDSSPNINSNFWGLPKFFPSTNNMVYEKETTIYDAKESRENRVKEEKNEFIYNSDGLISKRTFLGKDSLMNFYDYEYICD